VLHAQPVFTGDWFHQHETRDFWGDINALGTISPPTTDLKVGEARSAIVVVCSEKSNYEPEFKLNLSKELAKERTLERPEIWIRVDDGPLLRSTYEVLAEGRLGVSDSDFVRRFMHAVQGSKGFRIKIDLFEMIYGEESIRFSTKGLSEVVTKLPEACGISGA